MQTELDRIANQNHLQLIKALIPHLPTQHRKQFSVMIKVLEIQNVIRFYNSPRAGDCGGSVSSVPAGGRLCGMGGEASCGGSEGGSPDPPDLLDVLTDVRCYCEGEEQQMIDQILQMMSMAELFSVMAQDGEFPGGGSCSPEKPQTEGEDCSPEEPLPEGCGDASAEPLSGSGDCS